MARKGGRGGNKAARSAAAKKGWETRRRGGAKAKPAATKRTAASRPKGRPLQSSMARAERVANAASRKQYAKRLKSLPKNARRAIQVERLARRSMQPEMYKPLAAIAEGRTRLIANAGKKRGGLPSAQVQAISRSMASSASRIRELLPKPKPAAKPAAKTTKRRGAPKTTSARGRALTNQRRAADLVRASRGGKGPSAKAVRSVLTAQRARAFYDKTGGGRKRSAVKAKSAAKVGKSIRAQGRAKATAARARVAGRVKATLRPNKPNVSMAAMQRRSAKVSDAAILERRQRADTWRDEMAFRSGQYPKSTQKRADYAARSTQAEINRRQNALVTAQRARDFYAAATFSASNFSLRQRFSTAAPPRNRPLPALTSYFSAWRGYSYKPSKAKKRN